MLQIPCEESDEIESESDDGSVCSETADGDETPDIRRPMDTDDNTENMFSWTKNLNGFKPKMTLPSEVEPVVLVDVSRSTSELNTFLKLFPMELFEEIVAYTNMRLQMQKSSSIGKKDPYLDDTSAEEIMIVMGCILVMCYNRVPAMHMYWSTKKLLGNSAINDGISRNRFQKFFSKLYFSNPNKHQDATKTYYLDKILTCLKSNFINARSDSTYQSIDESMTKFKGRSSLKQCRSSQSNDESNCGQDAMLAQVRCTIPIFIVEKKVKRLKGLLRNVLLKKLWKLFAMMLF